MNLDTAKAYRREWKGFWTTRLTVLWRSASSLHLRGSICHLQGMTFCPWFYRPVRLLYSSEVNMHEYGIAQEMVALALENMQQHEGQRIRKFSIEMRESADESQDSLRFY